jgi:hypothetical protein
MVEATEERLQLVTATGALVGSVNDLDFHYCPWCGDMLFSIEAARSIEKHPAFNRPGVVGGYAFTNVA